MTLHDSSDTLGILRPELRLGVVSSVAATTICVNLGSAGETSGTHYHGARYGRGEVGEFILVESQGNVLLGRTVKVRLPERDRRVVTQGFSGEDDLDAIGDIQLLGSIDTSTLKITAGVDEYPRLGDRVYSAPLDFLASLPQRMSKDEQDNPVLLTLGTLDVGHASPINVTPEKFFGRHCAILGATGGGKSWTVARILEECAKHPCKIILLDATGEYRNFSAHTAHCHLGTPPYPVGSSIACSFPPSCFQESDFVAMFDPAGKVQGPKFRAAIRSLRLANLKPALASNGIIKKHDQVKKPITDAESDASIAPKLDDPKQEFDCGCLTKQIEQECVWPNGGTQKAPDYSKWGAPDEGSYGYCLSLFARISSVQTSSALACVFNSGGLPTITDQISGFLSGGSRLLRICLSGIQHDYNAREIIANALGRHLLAQARTGVFKGKPIIVFVDEAHNFLGRHIGAEETVARLDAFEIIAKEGRKYGLNICLATQRPRDITEGVLSQMGTLLVHRLTNDKDREMVERACGDIDRSASAFLPNLKPGEAALIGVDFPIPLTIQIQEPAARPLSDGPNFQTAWRAA